MTQPSNEDRPSPNDDGDDAGDGEGDGARHGALGRGFKHPWWVLVLVGSALGRRLRPYTQGDGWTAAFGVLVVAIGVGGILGAIQLQRGTRRPVPWLRMNWFYPPAGVIGCVGFAVGGASMVLEGLVDLPGDDESVLRVLAFVCIGFVLLGWIVQILSVDKLWPDRWQPPYRRRVPADDAPPAGMPDGGDDATGTSEPSDPSGLSEPSEPSEPTPAGYSRDDLRERLRL
jgi:hypothetical protein